MSLDEILTKEFLIEEYQKKIKPVPIIAKELGCNTKPIYNRLKKYNIPTRSGGTYVRLCPGYKQNWIEIIKEDGRDKNGLRLWKCRCICGKLFHCTSTALNKGQKSCGCYTKKKKNHRWLGYKDISSSYFTKIRYRANRRRIDFNISIKDLWDQFLKQNKKCYFTKIDLDIEDNASLDRIDSNIGYYPDNIIWVYKPINFMKHSLSVDEFIKLCYLVTKFSGEIKNVEE